MLRLTIREALVREDSRPAEPCIYLYSDGDTLFYIGRTLSPYERLRQHVGKGDYTIYPDAIGSLILENHPQSLDWMVEVWTVQELRPDLYSAAIQANGLNELSEGLESHLISNLKPCLNSMYRTYKNPLPEKYVKQKIANRGVVLGR